jgi:hypothetical protein
MRCSSARRCPPFFSAHLPRAFPHAAVRSRAGLVGGFRVARRHSEPSLEGSDGAAPLRRNATPSDWWAEGLDNAADDNRLVVRFVRRATRCV